MLGRTTSARVLNAISKELETAEQYLTCVRAMQLRYTQMLDRQEELRPSNVPEDEWQTFDQLCEAEYGAFEQLVAARETATDATAATL